MMGWKHISLLVLIVTGCAGSSQEQKSEVDPLRDYQAALDRELALLQRVEGESVNPQLRAGVKLDALSSLTKRGLTAAVAESMREDGSVKVLGKEVPLGWSSSLAEVSLQPDDACLSCLRADVTLAGRWDLSLPITKGEGESESRFSVIAPLVFEAGEPGSVVVKLDTSKALDVGGLAVETKVASLPDKLAKPVTDKLEGLVELAARKWVETLPPIPLFTIRAFEVADQVELVPAGMAYDLESKTFFFGLATNIGPDVDLPEPDGLGPESAASMTLAADLVRGVLSSRIREGGLSRRYDASGIAAADGEFAVTLDEVALSSEGVPQLHATVWTLEGKGAGQSTRHVVDLSNPDAVDSDALPLNDLAGAGHELWKRFRSAPIQAPGMTFGVGPQSTVPTDGVVHIEWGLVSDAS